METDCSILEVRRLGRLTYVKTFVDISAFASRARR
jgi:hypothetical protein